MTDQIVQFALFGWLIIGPAIAVVVGGRAGVAASVLLGWLLLPVAGIPFSGLPDYDKSTAVMLGALIGTAITGSRFLRFGMPKLIDIPMILWCIAPFGSSMTNGLGIWDGLSEILQTTIMWGVPYWLGRSLYNTHDGVRVLASAIILAGLLYVPLCLWEIRMSPQLHSQVYGFHQHQFLQTRRFSGWRPTVFLRHGLAVGLFMAACTVVAMSRAIFGNKVRLFGLPYNLPWIGLAITTILCKSIGSLMLMGAGVGALLLARFVGTKFLLYALILAVPTYVGVRTTGVWSGEGAIDVIQSVMPGRAESLQTRLDSEDILAAHALRRPLLGWGGHAGNRVYDRGDDQAITDGWWILVLGEQGLIGLGLFLLILLVPPLMVLWAVPTRPRVSPRDADTLALVAIVVMFANDSLLNAMPNPMFPLAMGALAALSAGRAWRTSPGRPRAGPLKRPSPEARHGAP